MMHQQLFWLKLGEPTDFRIAHVKGQLCVLRSGARAEVSERSVASMFMHSLQMAAMHHYVALGLPWGAPSAPSFFSVRQMECVLLMLMLEALPCRM